MVMVSRLLVAVALAGLAVAASATPRWPAPIQTMADRGLSIIGRFDAPGGLTGYAARAGRTPVALYLTADGQHVIVGTLMDANGQNLTRPALARLTGQAAGPDTKDSADTGAGDVWQALKKSHWIADGANDAPRTVYVITDPNCPYCHRFYDASRPWVKAGRVQLRHVIVGVLEPSSPGKAAALLAADDPTRAYRRHEARYREGGITALSDIPPALQDKITANDLLMSSLGIRGTPGIVYRKPDGDIAIHQGMPQGDDLTAILGPPP